MSTLVFVTRAQERVEVDVQDGVSVMHAAVSRGLDGVLAECGGAAACATCHVYVDARFLPLLPAATEQELQMLEYVAAERRPNSRLSCQIPMLASLHGLTVTFPDCQV